MARWQESVITNTGISMLGEVLNGGELVISSAMLGNGTVDTAALMGQTAVSYPLEISALISHSQLISGRGVQIQLQIRNSGISTAQVMKQVGIFAKVGDGEERLFAIMQNSAGEEIPSESDYPDFMLEFTSVISVSNAAAEQIVVQISSSAVITRADLNEALNDYVKSEDFTSASADKADKTYVDEQLKSKADSEALNGYVKTEDFTIVSASKADKTYVDQQLNNKADSTHTHTAATTAAAGFMTAADKAKLDGISDSADAVSVTRSLTSGTKIGTITINGVAADLYCQTNTDTKYSAGTGIGISGTTISNSGVRSVATGGTNGTIAVNTNGTTANVAVKGLASAAYQAVQTAAGTVGLHRMSSGTAAATTTNCPAGCWYGQYE